MIPTIQQGQFGRITEKEPHVIYPMLPVTSRIYPVIQEGDGVNASATIIGAQLYAMWDPLDAVSAGALPLLLDLVATIIFTNYNTKPADDGVQAGGTVLGGNLQSVIVYTSYNNWPVDLGVQAGATALGGVLNTVIVYTSYNDWPVDTGVQANCTILGGVLA